MKRPYAYRFRRTTLVGVFCVALLAGIGLGRVIQFGVSEIILASLLLLLCMMKTRRLVVLGIIILGVCVGGYRGAQWSGRLAVYDTVYDRKVTIIGQAANDAVYGRNAQLSFDLRNARVVDDGQTELIGKIGVSGFGENAVFRGDTVQVTGKIRHGTGSYQAWMSYAQLDVIARQPTLIDTWRRQFAAGLQSALPEPAASFGMGLLIGQKSGLPKEVSQDLLMVGLVHIIAVSGYNLTILLRASWRLVGTRSKYQTMLLSVVLIGTFLLFTGSSASIVRASIVSLLSLAAWYYGRSFRPTVLLLMTAAMTSLANPLYEWSDMGWYLSFLAFYGVLVLAPLVKRRFFARRFQESLLLSIGLESLCAELMTLPLILYVFGQMSLVNLPANVLVAVFVPLAMLCSLVAGLAGMLLAPIAGWLAWPATVLLTYMLDVAHILASIPGIFIEHIHLSLAGMLAAYGIVLFMATVLQSRNRRKAAIIPDITEEEMQLRPSYLYAAPGRSD